jgi:tetratricopeptide (TPR) repeat protein
MQKKTTSTLLLAVFFIPLFLLVVSFPSLLLAQESESQSSQVILQRQRLTEEIQDLEKQLLGQLNQYRQHEREYRIARDQYQSLQTLSSIEEVVSSTKKAMRSRNLVLDTYLNILRLKLLETEGVELVHQERALEIIEKHRQALGAYEQLIDQSQDREAINLIADEFLSLGEEINNNSFYVLSILSIGRLQSVYDKAVIINQKISSEESEAEEAVLEQSQRNRAINEVNKLITQLPPMFETVWSNAYISNRPSRQHESFYRNLTRELGPIHSRLSLLVSYFEELEGVK